MFKEITEGNTVIMGRKTFESIGRPLRNRNNIVLSKTMGAIEGVEVCKSLAEAISLAKSYRRDIFIIGGGSVFEQTIGIVDKMHISHVKASYDGDVFFPYFNPEEWKIERKEDFPEFEYVVYARKSAIK